VKKRFKPEFLNRLNDVVIFHPLNRDNLLQVITLEISKLQKRLGRREMFIELDETAKGFLVDKGFQVEMGARPLRRTIEQYLEDPLAEKMLMYPNEGRRCRITVENGEIVFVDEEVFPLHAKPKAPAASNL
jgi:ATP-dependent Clp protease ATP-binding subunit ClpC